MTTGNGGFSASSTSWAHLCQTGRECPLTWQTSLHLTLCRGHVARNCTQILNSFSKWVLRLIFTVCFVTSDIFIFLKSTLRYGLYKKKNCRESKCSELLQEASCMVFVPISTISPCFFLPSPLVPCSLMVAGSQQLWWWWWWGRAAWPCSRYAGRWLQHWRALLYSKLTGAVTSLAEIEGWGHQYKNWAQC